MLFQSAVVANAADIVWEKVIHSDSIDALCTTDAFIYSASFDGYIKKSSADSLEEAGAHKDWVRALLCIDDGVVSASNDGRIIIWKGASNNHRIHAHDWWITDIAFHNGTIVSVSLDETVKIWRYPDLKLVYQHKLYGSRKHHTVVICRDKAFVGSTWGISVLDLKTRKWIVPYRYFDTQNVFLSSTASDNRVYFGDDTGKLFFFDASTTKLISTQQVSLTAIKALTYHQGTLFVGDDAGTIRKVDAESMENIEILASFPQSVRAMLVRSGMLIAGCDGGILRAIRIPR
jgi:WD40 repeat protein